MRTSGSGNDSLMVLVPVGASVLIAIILFGGPANAMEAINNIVRDVAYQAITLIRAWF